MALPPLGPVAELAGYPLLDDELSATSCSSLSNRTVQ